MKYILLLLLLTCCQSTKEDKSASADYVEALKTDIYEEIDILKNDIAKMKKAFKKKKVKNPAKPKAVSRSINENFFHEPE